MYIITLPEFERICQEIGFTQTYEPGLCAYERLVFFDTESEPLYIKCRYYTEFDPVYTRYNNRIDGRNCIIEAEFTEPGWAFKWGCVAGLNDIWRNRDYITRDLETIVQSWQKYNQWEAEFIKPRFASDVNSITGVLTI